jgi:hypothetical protein
MLVKSNSTEYKSKIIKIGCIVLLSAAFFILFYTGVAIAQQDDIFGTSYADAIGLSKNDPRIIIARIIQVALGFMGIIAVGLILYAGFLYMTSQGDEQKIEKAKNIIKNAVIGIIIIASAFAIVSFILNNYNKQIYVGPDGGGNGKGIENGIGALGAGIIKSVYPEPGQREVPRGTVIIVTFRERMDASTICQNTSGGYCSPNSPILENNIRIFKTKDGDADATNVTDVIASSTDNETFVFIPTNALGSPVEYLWYSVNLAAGIHKANGNPAFGSYQQGFTWQFEVSDKLDLTPPQVLSGGVIPAPDNAADTIGALTGAVQASASIEVNGQPIAYRAASTTPPDPQGTSPQAKISGVYNCTDPGTVNVSISSGIVNAATGPDGITRGDSITDDEASIGCGLKLTPVNATDHFGDGNNWIFTVTPEARADTINIGSTQYRFVSASPSTYEIISSTNSNTTASNIAAKLNNNPLVTANINTTNPDMIDLESRIASADGNNIILTSSNNARLTITPFAGGMDREISTTVNGRRDKARNSVIQVNFNETMMPMYLSGSSTQVSGTIRVVNNVGISGDTQPCAQDSDCASYRCGTAIPRRCIGNELHGKFLISNQYRTVEFLSDTPCGVNACGQTIYCLPADSNLKVEIFASSLATCANSTDCSRKAPFITCTNFNGSMVCQDAQSHNYPKSDSSLIGAMDASLNSLDGNRNGYAVGPVSFYNENNTSSSTGDSYRWSFFINQLLDLSSPKISSTTAAHLGQGASLDNPVLIGFNKVMMSGTLTSGSIKVDYHNSSYIHKYINIWSLQNQPIGYWISKINQDNTPPDGEPDQTEALINHTVFSDVSQYRSQAGSGIKDIYQNCYRPSEGPACAGTVNDASPSCCLGIPTAGGVCPN